MDYKLPLIFSSLFLATNTANAEISIEDSWGKAQFYGSIRVLITDEESTPAGEANTIDRQTDIADGVSRIGLRGFVSLTDGVHRAVIRYQDEDNEDNVDDPEFTMIGGYYPKIR